MLKKKVQSFFVLNTVYLLSGMSIDYFCGP